MSGSRPESGGDIRRPRFGSTALRILAAFADSYPASAHYRGGRKLRKGDWRKLFPEMAADVEAKEEFLAAVDELVAAGIVGVRWQRFRDGSEVEALYLENPAELYTALGRPSPDAVRMEQLLVLDEELWAAGGELVTAVREQLAARLGARQPFAATDARDLHDLVLLLRLTPEEARRYPIRALSVRLYGDSKRLERLLPIADQITNAAAGRLVSEELGLSRRYPELSIALRGELRFSGRAWQCDGAPVIFPAGTAAALTEIRFSGNPRMVSAGTGTTTGAPGGGNGPGVLSVENKETFHVLAGRLRDGSLDQRFGAITYCGGHPHAAYFDFLALCARCGASLHHFGDLDPDGLLIFSEMAAQLPATVQPYLMDAATYLRYLQFGYRPAENRVERLAAMRERLPASILPLADEIVARGIGVEQEVVVLDA